MAIKWYLITVLKRKSSFEIEIGKVERRVLPLVEEQEFKAMLKNIKGCYRGNAKKEDCF